MLGRSYLVVTVLLLKKQKNEAMFLFKKVFLTVHQGKAEAIFKLNKYVFQPYRQG